MLQNVRVRLQKYSDHEDNHFDDVILKNKVITKIKENDKYSSFLLQNWILNRSYFANFIYIARPCRMLFLVLFGIWMLEQKV